MREGGEEKDRGSDGDGVKREERDGTVRERGEREREGGEREAREN